MMDTSEKKETNQPVADSSSEVLEQEGMSVYEYIVDNVATCGDEMASLIAKMRSVDTTGQFLASTARYLAAIDREHFSQWLPSLIEGAIERDREHRYIGSLLEAIWGNDYQEHLDELKASDNNFRRIYKRLHPEENVM